MSIVALMAPSFAATGEPPVAAGYSANVGLPGKLTDVVLPGSELTVGPVDDDTPVIIRIDAVRPHGTDHRYDLTVYGVEPGEYDLGDYLVRVDGLRRRRPAAVAVRGGVIPPARSGRAAPS
ncbi:MAG: hypothetical protein R3B90_05320 [Planctomycetaceae bacterium]